MKKIIKLCFSFLIIITAQVSIAEGIVHVVIDKAVENARPIAVIPFKNANIVDADNNPTNVISADLRYTSKFQPIPTQNLPQQPTTAEEVNNDAWKVLGVDNVVIGEVKEVNGKYEISYQLIDTVGVYAQANNVIMHGKYVVDRKHVRFAAHTISDKIFEKLTKIRGVARTKIAYVLQKNSRAYSLVVSDYDGANPTVIYTSSQPILSPAWSADGSKLAFSTFNGRKSELIEQTLANNKKRVLGDFNGHNGAAAYSPDGRWIIFSASKDDGELNLYLMDHTGGKKQQLTNEGSNTEPSWTADSQNVYFTSDRSGVPGIYMMNITSKSVTPAYTNNKAYNAKVAPGYDKLAFINNASLVVKDLSTQQLKPITNTFLDESPSFSPNGLIIIHNTTEGSTKKLHLVSVDGKMNVGLSRKDGQVKYPAWSPYLTKD